MYNVFAGIRQSVVSVGFIVELIVFDSRETTFRKLLRHSPPIGSAFSTMDINSPVPRLALFLRLKQYPLWLHRLSFLTP